MSGCPVDSPVQIWIESSLQWLTKQFGAAPLSWDVVTPTARFLPADYHATTAQIEDMVVAACQRMEVERQFVDLRLFDGSEQKQQATRSGSSRAVGHFHMEAGKAVVSVDLSEAADPVVLLAILVHELCHVRLLAENRIRQDRRDQERLTDLLTVFFGYGIFSTNAAMRFNRRSGVSILPQGDWDDRTLNAARNDGYHRLGYLKSPEFGYALSCYSWLRRDSAPSWERFLTPGPLVVMRHGLSYLEAHTKLGELPIQRLASQSVQIGSARVRIAQAQPPGLRGSSPGPDA
jgi:hypothetical protein